MINCKDCRHWVPADVTKFGECKRLPVRQAQWSEEPPDLAYIMIDPDEAWLCTRAEFGCVLGESK